MSFGSRSIHVKSSHPSRHLRMTSLTFCHGYNLCMPFPKWSKSLIFSRLVPYAKHCTRHCGAGSSWENQTYTRKRLTHKLPNGKDLALWVSMSGREPGAQVDVCGMNEWCYQTFYSNRDSLSPIKVLSYILGIQQSTEQPSSCPQGAYRR